MQEYSNKQIISLIDLTSLNDCDTEEDIIKLSLVANTYDVATVCIYNKFIPLVQEYLSSKIKVATVINFPSGDTCLGDTLKELEISLESGCDEIDLVMPYKQLFGDNIKFVENFISEVRKNCSPKILKVIIESGELKMESLIRLACKISLNCGANFIKTSTGKTEVGATIEATRLICEEIKLAGNCGLKVAGGVKTKADALKYLELTQSILGGGLLCKETFRFGVSSLLANLIADKSSSVNNNYY